MRLRSPHDRAILALAVPALGALAAEPLYVLVDTAIIGHVGTSQLAALALAATVLSTAFGLCNFLTYGTTAAVARLHGAGREADAEVLGVQALWLSLAVGIALLGVLAMLAGPLLAALGATGTVADGASTYLRIAALGAPLFMLTTAGQGFLRGVGDLRTPLVILLVAHGVNVVLEVVLVVWLDLGLTGSAWGTVIAQLGMGAAFVAVIVRRGGIVAPSPAAMRPLARVGLHIAVRTAALLVSFAIGSAVLARAGTAPLAAHQVAFGLWSFLALVLDALAIAGQVIVGRSLGSGDAQTAREASVRLIVLSTVGGGALGLALLALGDVVPRVFTDDPVVLAQIGLLWPLFAAQMPLNGAVFALDGILIGAGDARFLMWGMLAAAAVYLPLVLLTSVLSWGIVGVWVALSALVTVRLAVNAGRFASGRWSRVGAT